MERLQWTEEADRLVVDAAPDSNVSVVLWVLGVASLIFWAAGQRAAQIRALRAEPKDDPASLVFEDRKTGDMVRIAYFDGSRDPGLIGLLSRRMKSALGGLASGLADLKSGIEDAQAEFARIPRRISLVAQPMDASGVGAMVEVAADSFVEHFEQNYADSMDWRLGRGGLTPDEVVSTAQLRETPCP